MNAKTNKTKAAGPATKGLKVIARPEAGFRRAGHAFGREATTLPLSELSEEQAQAIKDEPMLIVEEVDIEPEKPAKG